MRRGVLILPLGSAVSVLAHKAGFSFSDWQYWAWCVPLWSGFVVLAGPQVAEKSSK